MQNNKKKRRILIWILFVILHINVPFSKTEELKPENKNNEEEENIFVFPSMQMEGIAAASSRDGKHVPVVEVVYRGQPPSEDKKVSKTTTSSSDKTKTTRDEGTWSFNSMNKQDFDVNTRNSPEKDLSVASSSVSWNPDSIDATANPNKGRKTTTTEKELSDRIGRMSTTTEKHEFRINVIEPKPPKSQNIKTITQSYQSIPGIKDSVLKSDDYQKWLEKKNSFLFQPSYVPEVTTMVPTSIAAPVSRWVLYSQEIPCEQK